MQRYSQPTASSLELRTQNKKTNIVSIWVRKQHPRTRNEECFGIRETPKSIRLHLNGILFRSKNAVLVHFGTHTTQHNTTQHKNPLLKVPRRRGTEDAGRLPAEEGAWHYFVVQNACHPPVGVAEKVYLCSATGQNVDSSPDIRSVSFLYRIFAAKEKITRIDP